MNIFNNNLCFDVFKLFSIMIIIGGNCNDTILISLKEDTSPMVSYLDTMLEEVVNSKDIMQEEGIIHKISFKDIS